MKCDLCTRYQSVVPVPTSRQTAATWEDVLPIPPSVTDTSRRSLIDSIHRIIEHENQALPSYELQAFHQRIRVFLTAWNHWAEDQTERWFEFGNPPPPRFFLETPPATPAEELAVAEGGEENAVVESEKGGVIAEGGEENAAVRSEEGSVIAEGGEESAAAESEEESVIAVQQTDTGLGDRQVALPYCLLCAVFRMENIPLPFNHFIAACVDSIPCAVLILFHLSRAFPLAASDLEEGYVTPLEGVLTPLEGYVTPEDVISVVHEPEDDDPSPVREENGGDENESDKGTVGTMEENRNEEDFEEDNGHAAPEESDLDEERFLHLLRQTWPTAKEMKTRGSEAPSRQQTDSWYAGSSKKARLSAAPSSSSVHPPTPAPPPAHLPERWVQYAPQHLGLERVVQWRGSHPHGQWNPQFGTPLPPLPPPPFPPGQAPPFVPFPAQDGMFPPSHPPFPPPGPHLFVDQAPFSPVQFGPTVNLAPSPHFTPKPFDSSVILTRAPEREGPVCPPSPRASPNEAASASASQPADVTRGGSEQAVPAHPDWNKPRPFRVQHPLPYPHFPLEACSDHSDSAI
uniref:Uncharacterized protein n=1 Tax=Chromera velia CCMP2878 TaxID=1169474 RepID=A0A0G4GCA9_9ALVE|eukprot:Cvel_21201.t1-p1 / transcript=Cvel_21201.t1 / gene=Cvel_21201 / organism=Chromera_velia_CCMP2878 / gene_product=hypothetical protein / transcript_product=hypothetical protein / location=Cvel_scaffold1968:33369-35209(-) / protein_length=571 / sequence_SO=supercontig / SO=protein_coding / is_pseudo=false